MKDYKEFTGYKQALAGRNLIFLATVGSTMLGLERKEQSDTDEMAVSLETPEQLLGFSPFEHDVYRSAVERTHKNDAKSEAGDVDLTIYGLRKFVRLLLTGNPNVLSMLYLSKDKFTVYAPIMEELQSLSTALISKEGVKAFLGYLRAQRMRLEGTRGQMRVNRDDLVGAHGYDTKYAMHAMRLAMQGYEFARTGRLKLPMSTDHIKYLTSIRSGDKSYTNILENLQSYEEDIFHHLDSNDPGLPNKPDYDKVEQWLIGVYRREWR